MSTWYGSKMASALGKLVEETSDAKLGRILRVDRRRLRALRTNTDKATLSLAELTRLDKYLHAEGRGGIAGFLSAKPTVFQSLVRCSDIRLLVGARNDDGIERVSMHDFTAAMELQETLSHVRMSAQLPPQVFHTKAGVVGKAGGAALADDLEPRTAWMSFGAPIANPFTELMLLRMTGERPAPSFGLTFPDLADPPSRFIRNDSKQEYRGVTIGDATWVGDQDRSHGLIVAQQDSSAGLRIACLGTTGASTRGAVRALADLTHEMPTASNALLLAVVEAVVVVRRGKGDGVGLSKVSVLKELVVES